MFDRYSFRAQQVIFLARLKAGERGAGAVEIEDLLAAQVGAVLHRHSRPERLQSSGLSGVHLHTVYRRQPRNWPYWVFRVLSCTSNEMPAGHMITLALSPHKLAGALLLLIPALSPMGAEVVFRFTSVDYALEEGRMLVFSSNIKGGVLKMHTGEELLLTPKEQPVEWVPIANGESSRTRVSEPGKYVISLHNLRVSRTRDLKEVRVPQFVLREYEITDAALKNGTVEIKMPGLIRVRAVDQAGHPMPAQEVAFTNLQARSTFQTPTDSEGEIYVLGNPEDYSILTVPLHDESVKLEISVE
jgi:hypothetical protein